MSQYYHLKPPHHISSKMLNVQPSFFLTEISSVSLKSLKITAFHWKCQISFYIRVKICFYPAQESKSRGLSIDKHFLCSNYQHQSDKLTVLYSYTPQLCKLGARGQMVTSQVWQHVTLTRPHKSERMASHTRSLLFLVSCSGWGPCDSQRIHMGMSEAGKPHFLVVKLFNFTLVTAFILKDDIRFFLFVCLFGHRCIQSLPVYWLYQMTQIIIITFTFCIKCSGKHGDNISSVFISCSLPRIVGS